MAVVLWDEPRALVRWSDLCREGLVVVDVGVHKECFESFREARVY